MHLFCFTGPFNLIQIKKTLNQTTENRFSSTEVKVQLQKDNLNIHKEQTFLPYQSLQKRVDFFTQKIRKILTMELHCSDSFLL